MDDIMMKKDFNLSLNKMAVIKCIIYNSYV